MDKLIPVEYKNQRIMTTKVLAEEFGTEDKIIQQNFKRNEERFKEGKHYYRLTGDELKEFKANLHLEGNLKFASELLVWTDRGAARHAKILDTDEAWEVYEDLEETYFNSKTIMPQLSKELQAIFMLDGKQQQLEHEVKDLKDNMPLFNIDCEELQKEVRKMGIKVLGGKGSPAYKDKSIRTKVYSDIQHQIKRQFGLNSYKAIKRSQLDIAKEIVGKYEVPFVLKDEIDLANRQLVM